MRRLEARGIYAGSKYWKPRCPCSQVLLSKHTHFSIATDPDCGMLSIFGNRWRGPDLDGMVSP
jgi:hypothetical protein